MPLFDLIVTSDSGWGKNRIIKLAGQASDPTGHLTEADLPYHLAQTGTYKHVLLSLSGDWEQINPSAEAEKLVDWLKEFDVAFLSE